PLRGRNPSNTNRSAPRPDTTSAASTALGPGTVDTSRSASTHARTRAWPGSETPGVPASVTYATTSPAAMRSTTRASACRSLWAWSATSRPRAGTPACVSSARVRRVSSAAIRSASRSVSTARGDRSPRLPIGVATTTSRPATRARPPYSLISRTSSGRRDQRSNAPAGASTTKRARRTTRDIRHGRSDVMCSTTPSPVQNATSIGKRMPNVSRPSSPRVRARQDVASSAVASTSPSRTSQAVPPACRLPAPISDVEADLEHVAVLDLVLLALDAELAELLRLRPRPDVEQVVPVDHLGADETTLQVRMDDTRALGCLGPGAERPRARLLVTRGEEGAPAEQLVRGAGGARQDALGDAEALEQLRTVGRVARRDLGLDLDADGERVVDTHTRGDRVRIAELVQPDVHDDEHRLVREQEHRREERTLGPLELRPVDGHALGQLRVRVLERGDLGAERLVTLRRAALPVEAVLDGSDVGEDELVLERREVVGGVCVVEPPQHVEDRVRVTQRAEQLRAESLARARAGREPRDVVDLERRVDGLPRLRHLPETVDARVRQLRDALRRL